MNLENSVMHELKLLTELLPNAVARNETLTRLEVVVSSHGDRLSALELKANNG